LVLGGEVLPEEGVVDVPATVEVDERLCGDLGLDIVVVDGFLHLLVRGVVAGYVGVVVFGVVELHDFARDGGFESAVVVWDILSATEWMRPYAMSLLTWQVWQRSLSTHEGGARESCPLCRGRS